MSIVRETHRNNCYSIFRIYRVAYRGTDDLQEHVKGKSHKRAHELCKKRGQPIPVPTFIPPTVSMDEYMKLLVLAQLIHTRVFFFIVFLPISLLLFPHRVGALTYRTAIVI